MYLGIDFIVEFLIGLVVGCMLWAHRRSVLPQTVRKWILDIRTNREREKAQEYLADMDQYRQTIKQQQYWMNRDWLAQKLHEEAAYQTSMEKWRTLAIVRNENTPLRAMRKDDHEQTHR